ncbi:glutamate ligase domain-containing protein, partial [Thermoproteota archaeon]
GRLNRVNCSNYSILDDTYNSNPLSLKSAIESLVHLKTRGRRILVMGDMLELGSRSIILHRQMGSFVATKPIDMFITLGTLSESAAKAAKLKSKRNGQVFAFCSKPELLRFLKKRIRPGDTLLIKGSRLLKMEEIISSLKTNVI